MNNAYLAQVAANLSLEEPLLDKKFIQEREAKIVRIISAIEGLASSPEWSTLKKELFDGLVEGLSKSILYESKKEAPDALKLRHLAGQSMWAERFADLSKFVNDLKIELKSIRQMYGKTKE